MRTALYRHFDADGVLLYIGISRDLPTRTRTHLNAADWAHQTATIRVQWFDTPEAAADAERDAIRCEKPSHNKTHVRPQSYPRPGWDGTVAHPDLLADILAFCRANDLHKTGFGIAALNDPSLISDIERGRELRSATVAAIRRYMATSKARAKRRAA